MNWRQALAECEPEDLVLWEAYYRLDPWGDEWTRSARIEAAIRNSMGGQPVDPSELIPNEDNRGRSGDLDDAGLRNSWKTRLGH